MPAVRVEVGYLTSPEDRAQLIDPLFRDRVVEAIVAAVQRMYLPIDADVVTGSIDVDELGPRTAAGRCHSSRDGRPYRPSSDRRFM